MNDTVREEVRASITKRAPAEPAAEAVPVRKVLPPRPVMITPPSVLKRETSDLVTTPTSPTLVGFAKSHSIPDWRLQMQNAVQMRRGGQSAIPSAEPSFQVHGGAALKVEPARPEAVQPDISDSRVANAMRRIEESRKIYLEKSEPLAKLDSTVKTFPPRSFERAQPILRTDQPASPSISRDLGPSGPSGPIARPRLVVPAATVGEKRDTNKLPRLIDDYHPATVDALLEQSNTPTGSSQEIGEVKRISIKADHHAAPDVILEEENADEIEDLAPFSMRFGAGLFDLIIGAFASMLLLSPIAFSQDNWFTTTGMFIYAATTGLVMFAYLTASLGFFGKTMGMRLFSLELVDAVENEYPTLYQAAVSSSLFLVSLPLAGAGFVTVLFNEEKRAVHDLASGTILVKEF